MVYLITGKAGAGKTHYGRELIKELLPKRVIMLDGDEFRKEHANNDFTDEGRLRNLMDAAKFAQEYEERGCIIVMCFVAPKKEWRDKMCTLWKESRVVYIPGGTLWEGTTYEVPTDDELNIKYYGSNSSTGVSDTG